MMTSLKDRAFQSVFSNLFVYNILWEDSEVDATFLGLDESSAVLAISAAGCGVAGLVAHNPASVDAVDINRHHLALAALKATAAMRLRSYDEFYALFGLGVHAHPDAVLGRLVDGLPPWIAVHWARRSHLFRSSLYQCGLTARMLSAFRRLTGVDADWMRSLARKSTADRVRDIDDVFATAIRKPHIAAALRSPAQLLSLGINFTQRDRLLTENGGCDLSTLILAHLRAVADTDLETNWFAWYAIAGTFNHDRSDAAPPFVRPGNHERSIRSTTRLSFRHTSILDRLAEAPALTWSHFMLCDAVDWMPEPVQRRLFAEIHRTSRDGGTMLYRSVEDGSIVERLGLQRQFRLRKPDSDEASRLDRTRQYRRVNFYEVVH